MKVALVIPTLQVGGAERVMSILANYLSAKNIEVHVVLLIQSEIFYPISEKIFVHKPNFDFKNHGRLANSIKIFKYLRQKFNTLKPDSILTFQARYNAFVVIATLGLGIKTYVSDRCSPLFSNGKFIDTLNKIIYPFASGFVVQTNYEKEFFLQNKKLKNVEVIHNPIKQHEITASRQNIILNLGRFDPSKHQDWLIDYFEGLNNSEWELWFVGDGQCFEKVKQKAENSPKRGLIKFWGSQKNVQQFYAKAKIFAFTSTTEGFPNSLGEAMAAGCACISFDCIAGPSDLILNNQNGILIENYNHENYKKYLHLLVNNDKERDFLTKNALVSIKKFSENEILEKYFSFITK